MRLILMLVFLLIAGCATTAGYEKVIGSWIGQSSDRLISSWGAPANITQLSDGGRVIEYSNQRNIQIGGYTTTVPQTTYENGTVNVYGSHGGSATGDYNGTSTTYVQKTTPVQNIAMQCITRFTVNPQGTITNWAWQGNDCKAKAPEAQEQQDGNERKIKIAQINEELKKFDSKSKDICNKQEYALLMLKTACLSQDITFVQLADTSKMTQDLKYLFRSLRAEIDAINKKRNEFARNDGFELDKQWADYMASTVQQEIVKYSLDLYNGEITWGDYNQLKTNMLANIMEKRKEMFPQSK